MSSILIDRIFCSRRCAGFTLVELVAVIAVTSVLAVIVIPRLDQASFTSRSFADRVRESLQYAQKTAVAQRRNVCVVTSSNTLTLTRAASNGDNIACTQPIADASGNAGFVLPVPSGVVMSINTLVFGSQGQPLSGGTLKTTDTTLSVSGAFSATITIEKITGLIR